MYNIMICDDDRDIVSALDIYLTSDGYRTYHAYDGLEALRMNELDVAADNRPQAFIERGCKVPNRDFVRGGDDHAFHRGTPVLVIWMSSWHRKPKLSFRYISVSLKWASSYTLEQFKRPSVLSGW